MTDDAPRPCSARFDEDIACELEHGHGGQHYAEHQGAKLHWSDWRTERG